MFRKMRRFKQQVSDEECIAILKKQPRGVMAFSGEGGYPYAIPLDFVYDEENGKLYFHVAQEGFKLDLIRRNPKVSFCVLSDGVKEEGSWWYHFTSVVIFGTIRETTDPAEAEQQLRKLGLKYAGSEYVEDEISKYFHKVQMLELTIDHMTGKAVREK